MTATGPGATLTHTFAQHQTRKILNARQSTKLREDKYIPGLELLLKRHC